MLTRPTAAVPTRIFSTPVAATLAPPDIALIVAVPEAVPALNCTIAWPDESVSASVGNSVPSVVVKVIWVPLCGGVPDGSITCTPIGVVPLTGRAVVGLVSVRVDPDGASSGTRSQATMGTTESVNRASRAVQWNRDSMNAVTILIHMYLAGQGKRRQTARHSPDAGYAMAALIIGIAVMAVMMTVVMPVWKQMVQREKEEELVFRGEQIAHSIGMFQRKFANAYPPTLDVLVEQKFLRKKYKDPITNEDFVPLTQAQGQASTPGGQANAGRGQPPPTTPIGRGGNPFGGTATPGAAVGGIIGVTSKSTNTSIRLYKGRSHYNEWAFVYTPPATGGAATPGGPGNPGGRGNNPGQRGNGPFPPGGPFGPGGSGGGRPGGPGAPGGPAGGGRPGGPNAPRSPGSTPFPFPAGPGGGR